jgi:hypothetical protein
VQDVLRLDAGLARVIGGNSRQCFGFDDAFLFAG